MRTALRFAAFALILSAVPACAETAVTFAAATNPPEEIGGWLAKPTGAGPFPAVALLPSCLGLPKDRHAIEAALTNAGYVALWVDDFGRRGLVETCTVDFPPALADARGAYAFLARQKFVDRGRIGAVGFSQGGDTALRIAAAPDGTYRAVAAFYPPCANLAGARRALPTLILIGERDEVTPAADCQALAEAQGGRAALVVFPGAQHLFDDPAFAGGARRFGMRLEYDRAAAEASREKLLAFLAEQLSRE